MFGPGSAEARGQAVIGRPPRAGRGGLRIDAVRGEITEGDRLEIAAFRLFGNEVQRFDLSEFG